MRLRIIILVLAILAVLSASSGAFLYYYSLRQAAFQQAQNHLYTRLELLSKQLNSHLSEHVKSVRVLAGLEEFTRALDSEDSRFIDRSNPILDNFARSLNLEVCYLMDRRGITVASSNRGDYDSFVGRDFSFRPYFKDAVSGLPSSYLALGTTSRKRGVYYSQPVYNIAGTKVIGAAVAKASVERIESTLFVGSEGILLVVDPNGVIFISNKRELRFMLLWALEREDIEKINATRQFGDGPWLWTGFSSPDKGHVTDRTGKQYIYSDMPLDRYPKWRIVHLRSLDQISRNLAHPFIRVIGPAVMIVAGFIAISVFILYRKALQEIIRRKRAENELRLSEARYRHIYHKTPVMLHSIDTKGEIIRVSDYWLEKMGYLREEVIGRKLTDFYSQASKKYAEEVILPVFFKTGFCEDVPYTYVTKDGQHIEILLSCFGVRDEAGNVVRSLAVSVDVTEKNQVQHALEKAREKLSCYSLNLEQQVEKRTDELRRAQDQLRRLSGGIMAAHENERRAVARELHDHLGQILTALKMDAAWIEKHLESRDEKGAQRAGRICSLIDDTIEDVREMAFRLRPGVLDDLGLVDALELMTREFEKRSDVSCRFRHNVIPQLDDTLATALYRIAQEAMTNALRHSGATDILVELLFKEESSFKERDTMELTIEDNGCGFASAENREYHGLGLTGMRERANLAGGVMDIFSVPGQGTRIVCHINFGET